MMAAFSSIPFEKIHPLLFIIVLVSHAVFAQLRNSCSDLTHRHESWPDITCDNAIGQSLHYDSVTCLSEEDVSVSWNVDPMPYSQEEYSSIRITLDYICYGNDSKISETSFQTWSGDVQASSYPLSNDVFSRADYCLFTGCIRFGHCWINTTNSVNVTCREDDMSQSSTEIVSPLSSSASFQYTVASSSTIIKASSYETRPMLTSSSTPLGSSISMDPSTVSVSLVLPQTSPPISSSSSSSSSSFSSSFSFSSSSSPSTSTTTNPMLIIIIVTGILLSILILFSVMMLLLLCISYWKRYNKRKEDREPYYIPSLDLESDRKFIELGASTVSIVTLIENLNYSKPPKEKVLPPVETFVKPQTIINEKRSILPTTAVDVLVETPSKSSGHLLLAREQSPSLCSESGYRAASVDSTGNMAKMHFSSLASSTDSGFTSDSKIALGEENQFSGHSNVIH